MIFTKLDPKIFDTVQKVAAILDTEKPIYLVGGAVRDALMERRSHDLDFVLKKGAIHAGRRVAKALGADFYPLDSERDTGRVLLQMDDSKRLVIDFAAMRGADLESDLRERDFSINAIAVDIHNPEKLIDPINGVNDILHRQLQVCSANSFLNDPIRILRAVRFSLNFSLQISAENLQLIRTAIPGLKIVTRERLRDELFQILQGAAPWQAVRLLDLFGVLPLVLPELSMLKALKQPAPHTLDAFEHSLMAVQQLHMLVKILGADHEPEEGTNLTLGLVSVKLGRYRKDLVDHLRQSIHPDRDHLSLLSFASLYHDTGKFFDHQQSPDGVISFLEHEKTSDRLVRERAALLRMSSAEINWLSNVVRNHMRPLWLSKYRKGVSKRAIYRFFRSTGSAGVDICLLSLADVLATYGSLLPQDFWAQHLDVIRALLDAYWDRNEEIMAPIPLLDGHEIMDNFQLAPGPLIGSLLESLREAQAVGEVKTRDEAKKYLETKINQG